MEHGGVIEVAKGISDYGVMIVICAAFIVLSLGMWIAIFKWFKSLINQIVKRSNKDMQDILSEIKKQNEMLCDVSEGLRTETQLRLKNLTGIAFDLSVEQVCRLIKRVREENHIADREATRRKIRKQLHIIHDDRNSRFDPFTYRGKCISTFCNPEWIEQVAIVVESEIYHEQGANNKRAYTNVKMAYDDIKLDFYHRMSQ
ncbi:MAG: hypothetical protein IKL83_04025 [Muribaculaceae bacterium]|nr:hypothetical protein [Muribaculaceae bacterium]